MALLRETAWVVVVVVVVVRTRVGNARDMHSIVMGGKLVQQSLGETVQFGSSKPTQSPKPIEDRSGDP